MGIQDRDYMRRSPEKQDSGQRLEAFFGGLLRRHPRLPLWVGSVLLVVLLVAILIAVLGK